MQLLQVFFPITVLLCLIESREYHYDRPAVPFHENIATNEVQSAANTLNYRQGAAIQGGISLPTVIQNSGPSATNYEIYDLKRSNQIFQGTAKLQPATPTYQSAASNVNYNSAPINLQVPQQVLLQHGTSNAYAFPSHTQAYATGALNAPNYAQQGAPRQVVQFAAQPGQSTLVNPFSAAATNFAHSAPQYRAPPAQLIATPQPAFRTPTQGNYVSQSESGHLDVYPHKQQGGDPRTYKRRITTCFPNGQCELLQLNAGPTDPNQNNVVWSTRSSTVPVPDKCRRIAEAKRQAALAGTRTNVAFVQPNVRYVVAPIRPPNRRLFPYSEIIIPRDTYNK